MNGTDSITIIIADDHPIFLKGLRAILEEETGVCIAAEAHDGASAWRQIEAVSPDVAILDLDMPGLDGLAVARRAFENHLSTRVVILTMHKEEELFRQAMDLQVRGYLLKEDVTTDIVRCVKAVHAGRHFIAPALSSWLVRSRDAKPTRMGSCVEDLSATQREVIKLIARGMTSRQIGSELGISHRTVENHRFRIVEKFGLRGNNSLLRFALERKAELGERG